MIGTRPERAESVLRIHVVVRLGEIRPEAAVLEGREAGEAVRNHEIILRGADATRQRTGIGEIRTPCVHTSPRASARRVTNVSTSMLPFATSFREAVPASTGTSVVSLT